MLGFLKNKRAQSTAEYAVVIALVIAAAVAMQAYVKRSMQGGIKFAVDKLQKQGAADQQYEPYYLQSEYNTNTKSYTDTVQTEAGGKVVREFGVGGAKTTNRRGTQKILDTNKAD